MASSLSNVANNLSEGICGTKCKYGHDNKKCETCGIKYKYCDCFYEYTNFKDDLLNTNVRVVKKTYQLKFDEKLKERFFNTYKFSIHDKNKFILWL